MWNWDWNPGLCVEKMHAVTLKTNQLVIEKISPKSGKL